VFKLRGKEIHVADTTELKRLRGKLSSKATYLHTLKAVINQETGAPSHSYLTRRKLAEAKLAAAQADIDSLDAELDDTAGKIAKCEKDMQLLRQKIAMAENSNKLAAIAKLKRQISELQGTSS